MASSPWLPAACSANVSTAIPSLAVQQDGALASYGEAHGSNFGTGITVAAPGKYVWTTDSDRADDYEYVDGSSIAAPFVTGLAGLLYSIGDTLDAPRPVA